MAKKAHLIKCDICGGNVSTGAEKCHHCGEINFTTTKVKVCPLCGGTGKQDNEYLARMNDFFYQGPQYTECGGCKGTGWLDRL